MEENPHSQWEKQVAARGLKELNEALNAAYETLRKLSQTAEFPDLSGLPKDERAELHAALAQLSKTFTEMQRWLAIDLENQRGSDSSTGSL